MDKKTIFLFLGLLVAFFIGLSIIGTSFYNLANSPFIQDSLTGYAIIGSNISENLTKDQFLELAKLDIEKMQSDGLSTYFVNDQLIEAQKSNNPIRFIKVIHETRIRAYSILDTITLLEKKEKEFRDQEFNIDKGSEFLNLAKDSFNSERYEEAELYLSNADNSLENSRKESVQLKNAVKYTRNFIQKYWIYILIGAVIFSAITPFIVRSYRKHRAKNKIKSLLLEKQTLQDLIKKKQIQVFKEKSISESTYRIQVEKFKKRLDEIEQKIPVYESIIAKKQPKIEKQGIIDLRKETKIKSIKERENQYAQKQKK